MHAFVYVPVCMYGRAYGRTCVHRYIRTYIRTYVLIVLGLTTCQPMWVIFMSSPREREKRDRRDSCGDEREGQGRKRNMNVSEETEEIKTSPLYPYLLQGLPKCKPISVGRPGDVRYTTPSRHPTTPRYVCMYVCMLRFTYMHIMSINI